MEFFLYVFVYIHSEFQVYAIVLLTVVTKLYTRILGLVQLITENLYPLTNIAHLIQDLSNIIILLLL